MGRLARDSRRSDPAQQGFDISPTPLRRVVTRGSVRVNGWFASRKMQACIPWESSNEKAFLIRAELDTTVRRIYAQAVRLAVSTDEGIWNHVPDFVVVTDRGIEVHEVKTDAEADDARMRTRLAFAARRVRLHGALYSVDRESALKAQPVYGVVLALHRRLHDRVPQDLTDLAIGAAQDAGCLTAERLATVTARRGGSLEAVYALVAQGVLRMDLSAPFGPGARVWPPGSFPCEPRMIPLDVPSEPSR